MSKKILVVDDQAFIRHIIGMELERKGYSVLYAENGEQAIDFAIKDNIDLILLDIMMPVMDGFETCVNIKNNPLINNIPILFLSANSQPSTIEKALKSGGVDFVIKTPNSSVLFQKISEILK